MLTCVRCRRLLCNLSSEQRKSLSLLVDALLPRNATHDWVRSFSTSQMHSRGKRIPKITQENINMQKKLQVKYSEDFIQYKVEEYDLGVRRLARMMGENPDTFADSDVKNAIRYLFPSDLFHKGSRPLMEHPTKVFPISTKIEADKNGRPFHHLFYTKHAEVYAAMTDVYTKILEVQRTLDSISSPAPLPQKLYLKDSQWKTAKEIQTLLGCVNVIPDHLYQKLITQLERLTEEPCAANYEDFIMSFRDEIEKQSVKTVIPELKTDENGRTYCEAEGYRKTAIASVKLYTEGTGRIEVNGKQMGDFFNMIPDRETLITPFTFFGQLRRYDVEATVDGGFAGNWSMLNGTINKYSGRNKSAMAGAIRLAISKALLAFVNEEQSEQMRRAGLLTSDIRKRERKKPGQEGARRKFTWKKR